MEEYKYFQDPKDPEKILGIRNCTVKDRAIIEFCGFKEVMPTFIWDNNMMAEKGY